jgi:hypothetical protein
MHTPVVQSGRHKRGGNFVVFITGYKVMLSYLDKIWELTKSDSLAALLGSMILLPDGYPIDAAVKDDWNRAVEIATTQVDNNLIMSELAYRSTLVYLKNWLDIATDAEIENVYLELLNCKYPKIWKCAISEIFS